MADGGGGEKECPTPCKKEGELCGGGYVQGRKCPDPVKGRHDTLPTWRLPTTDVSADVWTEFNFEDAAQKNWKKNCRTPHDTLLTNCVNLHAELMFWRSLELFQDWVNVTTSRIQYIRIAVGKTLGFPGGNVEAIGLLQRSSQQCVASD